MTELIFDVVDDDQRVRRVRELLGTTVVGALVLIGLVIVPVSIVLAVVAYAVTVAAITTWGVVPVAGGGGGTLLLGLGVRWVLRAVVGRGVRQRAPRADPNGDAAAPPPEPP